MHIYRLTTCLILLLLMFPACAYSTEHEALQRELHRFLTDKSATHAVESDRLIELERFYTERDYRSAWIQSGQPASLFYSVLSFLETAKSHGLRRENYQLDRLIELSSDQTLHQTFVLEFETTLSLLQFTRDLYRGRFDASVIDPNWHIPQLEFDAAIFLKKALDSGNPDQSFSSLAARNLNYQLLKQALEKFDNLISRKVTWTHIPNIPLLKPGNSHSAVPLIRQRITQAYETHGIPEYNLSLSTVNKQNTTYDNTLKNAIKRFQFQHGLNADGIIGPNTIKALNRTPAEKYQQLRINLERLRWLPQQLGDRYLLVNIAGFQLIAVEDNQPLFDMRIIVGRDYRSTPSFHSRITHMIVNPFWNVPASIARKDLLPKQQRNPDYLNKEQIKVYKDYTHSGDPIDPETIDWSSIKNGFPYALRQDPGAHNALGAIKFMLPNPYSIYLHDTPSKSLFSKDIRTFSSGCIRLESPLLLADFALKDQLSAEALEHYIESGKTKQINLTNPLPVYIVYMTVWVDSQQTIHYSPDSYERDKRALHLMN